MRRTILLLGFGAGLLLLGGCGSSSKNNGTHVYVVNNTAGNVAIYNIQGDGTLAVSNGSPFSVGANPTCLVMVSASASPTPAGVTAFAYGVNKGANTINVYNVQKDGSMAANSNTSVTDNGFPTNLVVDPSGKYLYAADSGINGSPGISLYDIDNTGGKLTPVSGAGVLSLPFAPQFLTISGSVLYAAIPTSGVIQAFNISSTDGTLSQLPSGSIVSAGVSPTFLTVSGNFVYSADNKSSNVYVFEIQSGGNLLPAAGSPFAVGLNPSSIAVGSGGFAFITNQNENTMSVMQVSSTGSLTPVPGSPFATHGQAPVFVAVSPAANAVYVADQASSKIDEFQTSLVNQFLSVTPFSGSPLSSDGGPIWITIR